VFNGEVSPPPAVEEHQAGVPALHPAVAGWFRARFPGGPTEAQARSWPHVQAGRDVLLAAPTGSGKTLAGFLMAIDAAYRAHAAGEELEGRTLVVYVSPLRALAVDVRENLERPLAEIAAVAAELGLGAPPVTVAVRTGDTPASARAAMVRTPPTILVTTPESLYLYLTAARSRETLAGVRTVIVDEIHALARDKRGSHLALSLERLERAAAPHPQRIGLSATQRPIEATAGLLAGAGRPVEVVDCGHLREVRVRLALPSEELAAVLSQEQLGEIVEQLAAEIRAHRSTLVFVNTRRLAERLAHLLGELLGPEVVAAHHGSLSASRRKRTEDRLRAGELAALVATASLELGIDVGPVDLACQVGSPRAIATFLQRVGRSNHSRDGVPEGVLVPTTRDELVECAALLAAVREGVLDSIVMPEAPLDILAQQLVAEVAAAGECTEEELFAAFTAAAPYRRCSRGDFDRVVELASEGIPTGRGPRMAFLHRDQVNGVLRPRRGARLAALTSGGAIPEVGDYRVVLEPDDVVVGSVNEDFAVESMAGDVFLLGTHAWRIHRVGAGEIRVSDAAGERPTIPFWLGEAPSRTTELSEAVSALRADVAEQLRCDPSGTAARERVAERCGIDAEAASQLVEYLACGLRQLGTLPTREEVVVERFFDEAGGMQLVVHAPFGGRVNRALGLALRKRFCVTFDFELQAAANDDAVILSLGPQHSFPLESVPRMLHPDTVRSTLEQAVLASPMFTSRWRWDLSRALAILRFRGGKRTPLPIQRMEADDLMAAMFPALAACQENTPPGPIELPDHLLVRQVLEDCLHEAMDVDGLRTLVEGLRAGGVAARLVDAVEPSVLAHEILNSAPYTFLDDAPLEERRARQVQTRRGLPLEAFDLTRLDPEAIARVRTEVAPSPRSADELHELLLSLLLLRPERAWSSLFDRLAATGRASVAESAGQRRWVATERRSLVEALLPGATFRPDHHLAEHESAGSEPGARPDRREGAESEPPVAAELDPLAGPDPDEVAGLLVRGQLGVVGPVTAEDLAVATAVSPEQVAIGLARAEAEGYALRGHFDPDHDGPEQWCARHLLARIHAYGRSSRRRAVRSVSVEAFLRFLAEWQHVAPGTRLQGRRGLLVAVEQLQGFEAAAGAWEDGLLSARVEGYQRQWLDELCLAGELAWARLSLPATERVPERERGAATPSRATPISFACREDLPWLAAAARGSATPALPPHGPAADVLQALAARGAVFAADLPRLTGRLPGEVEEGLWDLVARGLVHADSFGAVRSLLGRRAVAAARRARGGRGLLLAGAQGGAGLPGAPSRALGRTSGTLSRAGSSSVPGRPGAPRPLGSLRRTGLATRGLGEGRWAQLDLDADGSGGPASTGAPLPQDELAELVAGQLLRRWGVVCWNLLAVERLALPWREVLWALRRLEARGAVLGGRFVAGLAGEQYGLPEAVERLRLAAARGEAAPIGHGGAVEPAGKAGAAEPAGAVEPPGSGWAAGIVLSAADPLNLSGVLLPGPRIPGVGAGWVEVLGGRITALDPDDVRAGGWSVRSRRSARSRTQVAGSLERLRS
jgi:ATP-dependent Lhr-like helicase